MISKIKKLKHILIYFFLNGKKYNLDKYFCKIDFSIKKDQIFNLIYDLLDLVLNFDSFNMPEFFYSIELIINKGKQK